MSTLREELEDQILKHRLGILECQRKLKFLQEDNFAERVRNDDLQHWKDNNDRENTWES